jgi:hypothetical protein
LLQDVADIKRKLRRIIYKSRDKTIKGWSEWRESAGPGNKSHQGEDEMAAALCANI